MGLARKLSLKVLKEMQCHPDGQGRKLGCHKMRRSQKSMNCEMSLWRMIQRLMRVMVEGALANGESPPSHKNALPACVGAALETVFARLSDENLLLRLFGKVHG
ncbi:hypothetical protein MTO96_006652 [Rhipicephalus appendiculatus]